MSTARQKRLLERALRSVNSNPSLCLESVERLLADGEYGLDLLQLKARALSSLGREGEAAVLYDQLQQQYPGEIALALEALECYLRCFDYASIKILLPQLLGRIPQEEAPLVLCIRAAQALRQSEVALQLCENLVKRAPGKPVHQCKLGTLYQSLGRMQEAEQQFVRALELDSDYQPAWYFLAQLKKWTTADNHINELEGFLSRHPDPGNDTSAAHYALAKQLEDTGAYDKAFFHLDRGATQLSRRSAYRVEVDRQMFDQLREWFSASEPAVSPGSSTEGPIFILGMPRTGSTLVDRVLSSHDQVSSIGELMCFRRAVEELCGNGKQADFFAHFFAAASRELPYGDIGARYLEMIAPLLGKERYFIDKMPMNYAFVGLISRALPGARFVHTVRNPIDTCFSNYKQMFGKGYYGYSYDLGSLAEHYKLYRQLMTFWHRHLPGQVYDLHYERMVVNPEREVRALLSWLELDWQERCLQFHTSSTAVHTASVSQVRQPIYRDSVQKWRHFESHLGPLLDSLND